MWLKGSNVARFRLQNAVFPIILAVLLVLVMLPVVALASGSDYLATVRVTNNSTAATVVSVPITGANSSVLIDQGFVAANLTDVAIQSGAGADVAFMPGYSPYPWCIFVASITSDSIVDYNWYNNSTGGKIRYFPASAGMTVVDDDDLEISSNGTVGINGYLGASGYLVNKQNTMSIYYDAITSNITVTTPDDFTTDNFTDVGAKIVVNTVTKRLEYEAERSATDTRCYIDLGILSDIEWRLNFSINNTSTGGSGVGNIYFGLFENAEDMNTIAGDGISILINTATPVIRAGKWDNGVGSYSPTVNISNGTLYYASLNRVSSSNVSLSMYSNAARTTHIAGSPVWFTIPATVKSLRYLQAANLNDGGGVAEEQVGWIDDISIPMVYKRLTATNVTAGYEYDVLYSANTTHSRLYIDSVLKDSAIVSAIPNTSANWTFGGDATPYIERMYISKNGVTTGNWTWTYGENFTDLSVYGNTGLPSFRSVTSSANVSAEFLDFRAISTAVGPAYAVSGAPDFVSSNVTTSGNFTTGNATASTRPGSGLIDEASAAAGVPNTWLYGILSILFLALAGLAISAMERNFGSGQGTIFVRLGLAIIVIGIMVTFKIFDWWMLIFYLFIALAPAIQSTGWSIGGNIGEYSFIGFLATTWVGLTTINRIQEGQLITSAETAHLNTLMFTQEFTLLDVFHLPIINFEFFSKGIPSLLQWDYAFFGGNAQIIQYFLYSLMAIAAVIILGVIIGTVSSYFARAT